MTFSGHYGLYSIMENANAKGSNRKENATKRRVIDTREKPRHERHRLMGRRIDIACSVKHSLHR